MPNGSTSPDFPFEVVTALERVLEQSQILGEHGAVFVGEGARLEHLTDPVEVADGPMRTSTENEAAAAHELENLVARLDDLAQNTLDVITNSRRNPNSFEGNYWSHYSGYDLTGDGRGDLPYRPVRLFSFIVENKPVALILMRSFFVDVLEVAERVLPVLTPETLVDERPLMRPVQVPELRAEVVLPWSAFEISPSATAGSRCWTA